MLDKIFNQSKTNSKFNIFSQRGNANELKQGQDNLYYRMCTTDKSFRVGFQKYHNDNTIYLSLAVSKEKNIPAIMVVQNVISALANKQLKNCRDRAGNIIGKSWEVEIRVLGEFWGQYIYLNLQETYTNYHFVKIITESTH